MADQVTIWSHVLNPKIILTVIGGFLPPLIWLYFWLKEDLNPEPKKRIIYTFLAGMLSVFVALFAEQAVYFVQKRLGSNQAIGGVVILLIVWAFIEEVVKYFAAYYGGLKWKECDEPIDYPIYLITAALGFAALENVLFLTKLIQKTNGIEYLPTFLTGDLRFLGANLLHVATSALVGISLSVCFFHKHDKKHNLIGGLFVATSLHFLFNYFIIKGQEGLDLIKILKIMIPLWIVIVIIIFILEKLKRIKIDKSNLQTQ